MIRDRVLKELQVSPMGLDLPSLLSKVGIDAVSSASSAVESILVLSSEVYLAESKWRIGSKSKSSRILSAIEVYTGSTGKKIFRVSAALSSLSADEHPTADELREILGSTGGRFTLLPNAMIKRNG
jgi:hypothetical protein